MFRDERPIKLSSTRFKQELERRADGGLMRDTELRVSVECGVVVSNRFVCGFEGEGWHRVCYGEWGLIRGCLAQIGLSLDSRFFRSALSESADYYCESLH